MPSIGKSRYITNAGWNDVPHLTEDDKEAVREAHKHAPHLLEAAQTGLPTSAVGRIYPWDVSRVLVSPFPPPEKWPRGYGFDPAVNRTAALFGALDEANDVLHIYGEYFGTHQIPRLHAQAIAKRGDWLQGVCDPAAEGKTLDGRKVIEVYRKLGLKLRLADNAVTAGINAVTDRIVTGRLKVHATLGRFRFEWNNYRRDQDGKIVKERDDLLDCFDAETEVLTAYGWRFWSEVAADDELATVNLETDALEFQRPTELIAREHDGAMVRIKGRKLNLLVTLNHRMVVYPKGSSTRTRIKLADELANGDRIKLSSGGWAGEPRREPVDVKTAYGHPAKIDPHVWAEFLGWYVAEGSRAQAIQLPGSGYNVFVSQKDAGGALARLLASTPWVWNHNGTSFYTSCKWLHQRVAELGDKAWQKRAPRWVLDSDQPTIEAFLAGAVAGDGWVGRNGQRFYATTSPQLADEIQELFVKLGRSASISRVPPKRGGFIRGRPVQAKRDQFWLIERARSTAGLYRRDGTRTRKIVSRTEYQGMVYCATVPNGTLVVRRRGKPAVVGNCLRYICLGGLRYFTVRPAYTNARAGGGWTGSDGVADPIAGF